MTPPMVSVECGGDGTGVAFATDDDRAAVLEPDPADPLGLHRLAPRSAPTTPGEDRSTSDAPRDIAMPDVSREASSVPSVPSVARDGDAPQSAPFAPGTVRLVHPLTWPPARCADLAASASGAVLVPAPLAIAALDAAEPGATLATVHIGESIVEVAVVRRDGPSVLAATSLPIGERALDAAIVEAVAFPARLADRAGWERLVAAGLPDLAAPASPDDDPPEGLTAEWRLEFADAVRAARRTLIDDDAADLVLPGLTRAVRLRRFDIETPLRRALEPVAALLTAALADIDLPASDLAAVVLAGAAAGTPALADTVRRATGRVPIVPDEPTLAVARGGVLVSIVDDPAATTPGNATAAPNVDGDSTAVSRPGGAEDVNPSAEDTPAATGDKPSGKDYGGPTSTVGVLGGSSFRAPIEMFPPMPVAPVTALPDARPAFDMLVHTDGAVARRVGVVTAVVALLFAAMLAAALLLDAAVAAPAIFGIVVMLAAATYGVVLASTRDQTMRLHIDEDHVVIVDATTTRRWHWDRLHRVAIPRDRLEVWPVHGSSSPIVVGPFDAATTHHIRTAVWHFGHRRW